MYVSQYHCHYCYTTYHVYTYIAVILIICYDIIYVCVFNDCYSNKDMHQQKYIL